MPTPVQGEFRGKMILDSPSSWYDSHQKVLDMLALSLM